MANVLFKKGLLAGLSKAPMKEGTIYVTTDERAMYLDVSDSERIRLGDFIEVDNIAALPSTGANVSALYYATAENVLAKWNGTKWVQINPDNWFAVKSFAQSLTSSTTDNVTTITAKTTLIQKNEAGDEAASGSGASQWSTNLKFKDDGSVVTITKEGNDTIKISAKDEKVTSADNHYTYDESRDGPAVAATPTTDTNTGNTFITGVNIDKAGHVVGVKSREAVIDLVESAKLKSVTTTKDADSDANSAANINLEVKHGAATRISDLKVEGAGATTVASSNGGLTLKISSTDQTVEHGHHYNPSLYESDSDKITIESGKVLSEIKRDNAGHVIGVTKRDENKVSAVSMSSSGSENDVTLTTQVKDSLNNSPLGSIKFTGSGDAKVTAAAGAINIETHDEHVTSADNHYKALKDGQTDASNTDNLIKAGTYNASDITAAAKTDAKAETPVITGVTIDAAGHVTGVKAVKIADTHNRLKDTGTAAANTSEGKNINGWKFTLEDIDGHLNYTTFDPTIKYGKNTEGATTQTVHGVGGSFTLDTYTTGEVDAKITTAIQATGAMVLKGNLSSTDHLPTTDVAAGDTYIVTENGITVAGNVCEVGDLFVAKADIASGSTDANWYYVPSGNDKHIIIETSNDVKKTVGAVLVDGNQTTNVKYGSINFNSEASASPSLIKATKSAGLSGDLGAQDVSFTFSMEWGSF